VNEKPLTDEERQYVEKVKRAAGIRSLRPKACWRNAQNLMLHDDEKRLRYWECGYDGAGIPHAWVTINGKIVDVTHEAADRKSRREKEGPLSPFDYTRGVQIDRATMLKLMGAKTGLVAMSLARSLIGTLSLRRARKTGWLT
jgi:hypothetical protein